MPSRSPGERKERMKRSRTGRRPGNTDTREAILTAARQLFGERGFDTTTVRAIAAQAQVDPALVHHYFGTKERLFTETVRIPVDPRQVIPAVLDGDHTAMGARLVRAFIAVWDSPAGTPAAALLRSAMSNKLSTRLLREFLTTQILRPVMAELDLEPAQARLRSALVASQISGLAFMRYIVELEPLASMEPERVVAHLGPTVQRYLTGDLPD